MIDALRAAWARLSLYLPVLLMGVLALGTYWLVRNTPVFSPPSASAPARHEPDYFMDGFSVRTFDDSGRLKTEILGAKARHYPDTDTLEIDRVRIRSFDELGRLTTASGELARTNRDASVVELFGRARVVRAATHSPDGQQTPELAYQGEYLHAFLEAQHVRSDKPVELTSGPDRFTAESLDYDHATRVISLKGRVRGVLWPTRSD